jgi:hypothetical protein
LSSFAAARSTASDRVVSPTPTLLLRVDAPERARCSLKRMSAAPVQRERKWAMIRQISASPWTASNGGIALPTGVPPAAIVQKR